MLAQTKGHVASRTMRLSIKMMLVAVGLFAIYAAYFARERRSNSLRREAYARLEIGFYTCSPGEGYWPLQTKWLHDLIGDDPPVMLGSVTFNNFALINDSTLKELSSFPELNCLSLAGEIQITENGLMQLKKLQDLKELYLPYELEDEWMHELQEAIPDCEISTGET